MNLHLHLVTTDAGLVHCVNHVSEEFMSILLTTPTHVPCNHCKVTMKTMQVEVHRIWIRIRQDIRCLIWIRWDPDPAGYKNIRIRQNPDPAGSKTYGSGPPDSLPCSTNHRKHALFVFYLPMPNKKQWQIALVLQVQFTPVI